MPNASTSVVIIADNVEFTKKDVNEFNLDIDKTTTTHINDLLKGIKKHFTKVTMYDTPAEFIKNVDQHLHDIIIPNWMGELSRNRAGLVPAICEACNIRFVGGDSYTRIFCGDKHLSKILLSRSKIETPYWITLQTERDIELIQTLTLPVVVKPTRQNSSIGIGPNNLITRREEIEPLARQLQQRFRQPVMVEEFVPGKEVTISMVGDQESVKFFEASERYVTTDEDYFTSNLFDAFLKKQKHLPMALRPATDLISQEDRAACEEIFERLERVNMIRIDGRYHEKQFHALELNSNPVLSPESDFMAAFIMAGLGYDQMLRSIIQLSMKNYR